MGNGLADGVICRNCETFNIKQGHIKFMNIYTKNM